MSTDPIDIIPITPAPTCPPDAPEDVQQEFARFAAQMGDRAKPIDETALLMLSQSVAIWKHATAAVNSLGLLVSSGGVTIPNPSISIAAKAQAQALKLLAELRLTPRTRRKQAWHDVEGEDEG